MPDTPLIILNGEPRAEAIVKIGPGHVLVVYDRQGRLRLIRKEKEGKKPGPKPRPDETVFRVTQFTEGEATFKSSGSHCGFFSVNGNVYWSAIWDDVEPAVIKKCGFQDWVQECAQVLAGEKNEVTSD